MATLPNQDVDAVELLQCLRHHGVHCRPVGYVGQHRQGADAEGAGLFGHGVDLGLIGAGVDHDVDAFLGQGKGGGAGRYCGRSRL